MSKVRADYLTRYKQVGTEPMAKKVIGVRLPVSMDASVRELAGDDLSQWIREAIAEKLARETKKDCA